MRHAFLILPLALLAAVPHAQQARSRVGFVDVQQAVAVLPGSGTYLSLSKKIDADLKKKQAALQRLATRASSSRSAADQQALVRAQRDLLATQKGHQSRLATAFAPLAGRINTAIAGVARGSGFTVVLDRRVAGQTNLVVYANNAATDLTPAVIRALKK